MTHAIQTLHRAYDNTEKKYSTELENRKKITSRDDDAPQSLCKKNNTHQRVSEKKNKSGKTL